LRALPQASVGDIGSLKDYDLTEIAALYFVGGVRVTFSIGVGAGGPAAYWFVPILPGICVA
jgi:hypothetical protein